MSVKTMTVSVAPAIVEVDIADVLAPEDCRQIGDYVEPLINAFGIVRLLIRLDRFNGWASPALWEAAKWGVRHPGAIERIVIVGDEVWAARMSQFCEALTDGPKRSFPARRFGDAESWLFEQDRTERRGTR